LIKKLLFSPFLLKIINHQKMKKVLLTAFTLAGYGIAMAQLPVSTTPQNKKVVLEEFTGVNCVYCPDGHKMANQLIAANPGNVIAINVHTGGYAAPGPGQPDFRTAEGTAIAAIPGTNITGYPTGSINRHLFTGESGFAVSRSKWNSYATQILGQAAYVNVALEGTLNASTRVLNVNVELYYTGTTTNANKLTVALLEDGVYGDQVGASNFYPQMITAFDEYTHNHVLRKVLTTQATGETITTTTSGTLVTKSYSFTVPNTFVNTRTELGNLKLVAFVAEGDNNIINAAEGPITITNIANTKDLNPYQIRVSNGICIGQVTPLIKVFNAGSSIVTAASLNMNVNGGANTAYNFSGSIKPLTTAIVQMSALNFTATASNVFNVVSNTVNGAPDEDASNNTVSTTVAISTQTGARAEMTFVQDRYGSESSWEVKDEAGVTVAQDGPFTDLSANGTQSHVKSFTLSPNKCYTLSVKDGFGDGINSGFGTGGFTLKVGGVVAVTSNGQYGKGMEGYFKTAATLTGVDNVINTNAISLYPNPANDKATLEFNVVKSGNVTVQVVDLTGRVITTVVNENMTTGAHQVTVNTAALSSGVYNVQIRTEEGTITQRLSVVK